MNRAGIPTLATIFLLTPLVGHAEMCDPTLLPKRGGPFLFCELNGIFKENALLPEFIGKEIMIGITAEGRPLASVVLTSRFGSNGTTASHDFGALEPKITDVLQPAVCQSSDFGGFVKGGGAIKFIFRYAWDDIHDLSPTDDFSSTITSCEAP